MKKAALTLTTSLLFVLAAQAVNFTLHNGSLKSIPLVIPGVMNPNLSPLSNSGVDLAVGQEIYFKQGRKKYFLLEVTEDLAGEKVKVANLIKERKAELGLKGQEED